MELTITTREHTQMLSKKLTEKTTENTIARRLWPMKRKALFVVAGIVLFAMVAGCAKDNGNEVCMDREVETVPGDCDNDGVDNNVDEFDNDAARSCRVTNDNRNSADVDCDNDGVNNGPDNCPAIANANQANSDENHPTNSDDDGDACDDNDDGDMVDDVDDVDDDGDGLIEIYSLEDLNNIRYDLNGSSYDDEDDDTAEGTAGDTTGAPTANSSSVVCDTATDGTTTGNVWLCGYELMNDLDFDTNGDDSITADDGNISWGTGGDAGNGWLPIDGSGTLTDCAAPGNTCFEAILDGNGNGIANLFINRGSQPFVGLIGRIAAAGAVRNLTLTDVSVTGQRRIGGLAGLNSGTISASDVSGSVTGMDNNIGGLVGTNSGGTIDTSSSDSAVTGTGTCRRDWSVRVQEAQSAAAMPAAT